MNKLHLFIVSQVGKPYRNPTLGEKDRDYLSLAQHFPQQSFHCLLKTDFHFPLFNTENLS